jgi:hypothetical protein
MACYFRHELAFFVNDKSLHLLIIFAEDLQGVLKEISENLPQNVKPQFSWRHNYKRRFLGIFFGHILKIPLSVS